MFNAGSIVANIRGNVSSFINSLNTMRNSFTQTVSAMRNNASNMNSSYSTLNSTINITSQKTTQTINSMRSSFQQMDRDLQNWATSNRKSSSSLEYQTKLLENNKTKMQMLRQQIQNTENIINNMNGSVNRNSSSYRRQVDTLNSLRSEYSRLSNQTNTLTNSTNALRNVSNSAVNRNNNLFSSIRQGINQTNANVNNNCNMMTTKLNSLKKLVSTVIAGIGTKKIFDFTIGNYAEFEQYQISFEVMMKSADKAKKKLQELSDYASTTPFELPDVIRSAKVLMTFGLESQKFVDMAGNLASASGASIEDVARAIGRLNAGDFGEAFERLRDFGISRKMLEGEGLVFDKGGSYKGSTEQVLSAVEKIINDKFGGMTKKQSESMKGLISTFKDSVSEFGRTIGEKAFPMVKTALRNLMSTFEEFKKNGVLNVIGDIIANLISLVAKGINSFLYFIMNINTYMKELSPVFESLKPIANTLINTFKNVLSSVINLFNELKPLFTFLLDKFNEFTQSSAFKTFIDFATSTLAVMSEGLKIVVELIGKLTNIIIDKWAIIQPILFTIGAIFISTKITSFISTLGLLSTAIGVLILDMKAFALSVWSSTVALFTNPIFLAVFALIMGIFVGYKIGKNWDKIKEFFLNFWNGIKEKWNSFLDLCSEKWSKFKEMIFGIPSAIGSKLNELGTNINNFKNTLTYKFSDMTKNIKNWASETKTKIIETANIIATGFIDRIKNSPFAPILNYAKDFIEGFKNTFSNYFELLKNLVLGPILLIINLLTGNFEEFKNNLRKIKENIINSLKGMFNGIKQMFSSYLNSIKLIWTTVWNSISNFFIEKWNNIKNFLSEWWTSLCEWFVLKKEEAINFFVILMPNLVKKVADGFSSMLKVTKDKCSDIKNAIVQKWNDTIDWLGGLPRRMWIAGKNAINNLISAIKDRAYLIKSNIVNAWNSTLNWLENLPQKMWKAGTDAVQGMINGIKNKMSSLIQAGKNIGNSIVNTIKDVLGIHSPSRVLKELGGYTGEGFDIGLRDSFKKVRKTALNLKNILTNSIDSNSINANFRGLTANLRSNIVTDFSLRDEINGGVGLVESLNKLNLQTNLIINDREIAKATSSAMSQEFVSLKVKRRGRR